MNEIYSEQKSTLWLNIKPEIEFWYKVVMETIILRSIQNMRFQLEYQAKKKRHIIK